jgi:hypothetical protein
MVMKNFEMLLLAAIVVPCLLMAVRYWQHALFSVFVLLVLEGALRKWVFPSGQALIYFVKDVVLMAAYLGFFLYCRRSEGGVVGVTAIRIVLSLTFLFGFIEVFNPNSPSVLVGIMGLKAYFLYAPIAFILPYAFRSQEQFVTLMRRYVVMAIPVAILGFVQVAAGPESSINAYVSHSEDATSLAVFGGERDLVRTSGTFSYIAGYTVFLTFIAFLSLGYNLAQGWRLKNNITPLLALILVVGAMFTTGSRAPVYTLIVALPIILWLAVAGRILSSQTAVRLIILVPVIALLASNISSDAFEAFAERAAEGGADDTWDRIVSPIVSTMEALSEAPAFGIGIGTTHPSALSITGDDWPWWLQGLFTEDEMARVSVELGFVGLFLTYLLRFLIAAFAVRAAISFKNPMYRAFGIVFAVHLGMAIMVGFVMLNPTAGLYYWGAFGLVLAMRRLEQFAVSENRSYACAKPVGLVPSAIRA